MDEAHAADQVLARVNASDAVSIINAASGYSAATNGIFPDRVLKRDFTKVTHGLSQCLRLLVLSSV